MLRGRVRDCFLRRISLSFCGRPRLLPCAAVLGMLRGPLPSNLLQDKDGATCQTQSLLVLDCIHPSSVCAFSAVPTIHLLEAHLPASTTKDFDVPPCFCLAWCTKASLNGNLLAGAVRRLRLYLSARLVETVFFDKAANERHRESASLRSLHQRVELKSPNYARCFCSCLIAPNLSIFPPLSDSLLSGSVFLVRLPALLLGRR